MFCSALLGSFHYMDMSEPTGLEQHQNLVLLQYKPDSLGMPCHDLPCCLNTDF